MFFSFIRLAFVRLFINYFLSRLFLIECLIVEGGEQLFDKKNYSAP